MTSLFIKKNHAARKHAAFCSLFVVAAAGGCTKPFGDLGSAETEGTSEGTTEAASEAASEAATEPTSEPTGDTEPQGPPDQWDDELAPQAGTRLRPIVREAEDGSTQHVAWQDTQEDVRCTFRVGEDGVRRCFPEFRDTYVYYGDPECKTLVMRTHDDYPHDILEIRDEADYCAAGTFYRLASEPFVGTLYRKDEGCVEHSMDPGYFVATPMVHTDFVAAAVEPAEGNSRIVPLILAAEDGARAIAGAWDREHGEEVVAQPATDAGQSRWFGRYAATSPDLFGDAACTMPLAGQLQCTPPDRIPATGQTPAQSGCEPQTQQRWRLGAPFTASEGFGGDACEPSALSYWEQVWSVAEALTDADFGLAPATTDDGTRLQRAIRGNPEGEPFLGEDVFFDPKLGEPCRFNFDPATGTSRCYPLVHGQMAGIYLDDACTKPVAYAHSFDDCEPPPAKWAIDGMNVRPLLEVTGWGDFKLEDGQCVIADDDFDYPDGLGAHTVYSVGPVADFTLVQATDVVK